MTIGVAINGFGRMGRRDKFWVEKSSQVQRPTVDFEIWHEWWQKMMLKVIETGERM